MVVLDTDHVSLLDRLSGAEYVNLAARLSRVAAGEIFTTIITFEEQTRGRLAYTAGAQGKSLDKQVEAYAKLHRHLDTYRLRLVLSFDDRSAAEFERLRAARIRVGTMDLRIASIVLANGATLLSRNLVDFRRVPGLHVEDWSVPRP